MENKPKDALSIIGGDYKSMYAMAELLVQSQLLPPAINTPQKAFLIMQQGKELGLQPMQSINNIHIIEGKTAISSNLMVALIQRSAKVKIRVKEWTKDICTIIFSRDGEEMPPVTFTIDEAKEAGLLDTNPRTGKKRENWFKYRKDMLKARCIARGSRLYAGDIIFGMLATEELNDMYTDTAVENTQVVEPKSAEAKKVKTEKKIDNSIKEVVDSMVEKIDQATSLDKLDFIAEQISKNAELGLISDGVLDELRKKYTKQKNKFLKNTNEK